MSADALLPTVVLEEGALYWIKPRYGDHADRWTVAKWEVGSFWGINGGEVSPAIISGPIPHPAESGAQGSERSDEGNLPPDALIPLPHRKVET